MEVNFEKIDKGLLQLQSATNIDPASDLEIDGVIQRLEYTIELLWKVSRKVLAVNGIFAVTPKDVIRELVNIGWITNPEELISFLRMKNETSHSYEEDKAKKAHQATKDFAPKCAELIKILKNFGYTQNSKFYMFGSRVKGAFREYSDIDLLLVADDCDFLPLALIDFKVLDIPYKVDLVLEPKLFSEYKEEIFSHMVELKLI